MEKGYYLEQQKVALQDIIAVTKDIGIFLKRHLIKYNSSEKNILKTVIPSKRVEKLICLERILYR